MFSITDIYVCLIKHNFTIYSKIKRPWIAIAIYYKDINIYEIVSYRQRYSYSIASISFMYYNVDLLIHDKQTSAIVLLIIQLSDQCVC